MSLLRPGVIEQHRPNQGRVLYAQRSLEESQLNLAAASTKGFLLILVLGHALNKNQPDATLAPLGNFFYLRFLGKKG